MMPNYNILPYLNAMTVARIDVTFTPCAVLSQKAWIGAALRNRFLYACEQIITACGTLREELDTLPVTNDHFLYRYMAGGFPKGYICEAIIPPCDHRSFILFPDKTYNLRFYIFGTMRTYIPEIMAAIRTMACSGLGAPPVPLVIKSIDCHDDINLAGYAKRFYDSPVDLTLRLRTPLSLVRKTSSSNQGYDARLNGFPSLYRIVHSATSRLTILNMLYGEDRTLLDTVASMDQLTDMIDNYAGLSTSAWLKDSHLRYVTVYSTPKKGADNVYRFGGYEGEMSYSGVNVFLLPLLKMMGHIAVGNDVSFGMGFYNVIVERQ